MSMPVNRRVLLIDDTPSIHEDFRKVLGAPRADGRLADMEAVLFGHAATAAADPPFELDSAFQGRDGLAMVQGAIGRGQPYAMAFVDMRMPPGWDGLETVERLWQADPELQVAICTAYSDHPWDEVLGRLQPRDRLLVLKKPFDAIEVTQLARSQCAKWSLAREAAARERQLEDAVRQRTQELAIALEAAQAANAAKSGFLANMSHELRTPMNAILGLLHVVMQADLGAEQRGFLEKAHASGEHLLRIVNDVLDFAKAEAGRLAVESTPFDLGEVLQGVADLLAGKARAKGLQVALDIAPGLPRRAVGDAQRLRQILLNLADNAVKFTDAGRVGLRAAVERWEGGGVHLRFEVSDTGIGISQEQLGRLFRRFEQADASITRRFGGTGLGLAISRQLAQLMGGEVGVTSTPGEGTTFWLRLRLGVEQSPAAAPASGPAAPESLPRGKVLLVEDNEINQIVARELLRRLGMQVEVAAHGAAALERIGEGYDLVLMDMQMPTMDGLAATRAIRRMPGARHLPVIAMTANVRPEDRQQCIEAGMDDFLPKPIEPPLLRALLAKWLARRPSGA